MYHNMEYYSAVKKNEECHLYQRGYQETAILHGANQAEKDKYNMIIAYI